ncbi:MAG: tetratricopeptide repeat protein [Bacteroidota bacterium]
MSDSFERPTPTGGSSFKLAIKNFRSLIHSKQSRYFDVSQFEEIVDYFLNSGEFNYANIAIDMALDQHPQNGGILLRKSEICFHQKKYNESLQILDHLRSLEPNNPDVFITLGAVWSNIGNAEKAIHFLELALSLSNPIDSDHILEALGYEFWALEDFDKSLFYFKKSLRLAPENSSLLERVYEIFASDLAFTDGIAFFTELSDKSPYNQQIWFYIASLNYSHQEFAKAKFASELVIAIDNSYADAYRLLANCFYDLKKYNKAIENYKIFMNRTRVSSQVLTKIGECYEMKGHYKYAEFYFKKAIELNPKFADAYLGFGLVCNNQSRHSEALQHIKKAIQLNPKQNEYWHFLALCHGKSSEFENAVSSFERSIELDPKQKITWIDFIDFLREQGEWSQGIMLIERALKIFANDEELLIRKMTFLLELGMKNRALSILEKRILRRNMNYDKLFSYCPSFQDIFEVKELLKLYS